MAEAEKITDRLTDKAGPLPVWGWVLIIGVGIYWWNKRRTAAASTADTTGTDTSTSATNGDSTYDPAIITADYDLANELGLTQSQLATLATNVGANTTATVQNTGAIKTGGLKGKVPVTSPTHKQPGPTPQGAKYKTYVVKPGDTLSKIAGSFKISNWEDIYKLNKSVIGSNPNQIKPGEKLKIPA